MKQTAVDWLKSQIELTVGGYFGSPWAEIFEKAKAMEKEEIMMAYNDGRVNAGLKQGKKSEQYYNETYGK